MKPFFAIVSVLGLLFPPIPASSENPPATTTWKRLDGISYEEPKIRRIEDGKLVLQHKSGFASVPVGYFSDDDLRGMGLDPANFPEIATQREEVAMRVNLLALKKSTPSFQTAQGVIETIQTAEIEDIDPVNLLVVTNGVPRRIPLESLPAGIQEQLGYDPEKAAAYLAAKEEARQAGLAALAKQQEAEAKRKAELEKARAAEARKSAGGTKTTGSKPQTPFERSEIDVFQRKK